MIFIVGYIVDCIRCNCGYTFPNIAKSDNDYVGCPICGSSYFVEV